MHRLPWGERRVYTEDANGALTAYPIEWTSRCAQDPTRVLGEAKAHFRLDDLLHLAQLIDDMDEQNGGSDT